MMDKLWEQTYFSTANVALQSFAYQSRIIKGVIQKNEGDPLDYLNDIKPKTSAVIWFPVNATPLTQPFMKGQYLTSNGFRYQIESAIAPCGVPRYWSVTATVDRMKPEPTPELEPEEQDNVGD